MSFTETVLHTASNGTYTATSEDAKNLAAVLDGGQTNHGVWMISLADLKDAYPDDSWGESVMLNAALELNRRFAVTVCLVETPADFEDAEGPNPRLIVALRSETIVLINTMISLGGQAKEIAA